MIIASMGVAYLSSMCGDVAERNSETIFAYISLIFMVISVILGVVAFFVLLL
jgi:hypothetical protein